MGRSRPTHGSAAIVKQRTSAMHTVPKWTPDTQRPIPAMRMTRIRASQSGLPGPYPRHTQPWPALLGGFPGTMTQTSPQSPCEVDRVLVVAKIWAG
jgi:hypothetical protein